MTITKKLAMQPPKIYQAYRLLENAIVAKLDGDDRGAHGQAVLLVKWLETNKVIPAGFVTVIEPKKTP